MLTAGYSLLRGWQASNGPFATSSSIRRERGAAYAVCASVSCGSVQREEEAHTTRPALKPGFKMWPTFNSCVMLWAGVIRCALRITLSFHISGVDRLSAQADFFQLLVIFSIRLLIKMYYFGSHAAPSHKMSHRGQYLMCNICHSNKHWIIWISKATSVKLYQVNVVERRYKV